MASRIASATAPTAPLTSPTSAPSHETMGTQFITEPMSMSSTAFFAASRGTGSTTAGPNKPKRSNRPSFTNSTARATVHPANASSQGGVTKRKRGGQFFFFCLFASSVSSSSSSDFRKSFASSAARTTKPTFMDGPSATCFPSAVSHMPYCAPRLLASATTKALGR